MLHQHNRPAARPPPSHPASTTPTQSPGTPTPTQSPGLTPNPVRPNEPPSNIGNNSQNTVDDGHHHRGNFNQQLIPGYYGTNYWDNGYLGNQSQYYGQQYGQNEQNSYGDQQQQQSNQTVSPNQAPALIEPPRQADTPSLAAALQASPAYLAADAQVREAQTAYDAASEKVTDKLKQSPDYQQALQRKMADAAKVSANKAADPTASPEKAEPAAQAKLDAAKTVSDMEREALAADPQAVSAKSKLDICVAKRMAIRAQIQESLPNSASKH